MRRLGPWRRPFRESLGQLDPLYLISSVAAGAAAMALAELFVPRWLGATPPTAIGAISAVPLVAFPMYSRLAVGLGTTLCQIAALGVVAALVPSSLPAPALQIVVGGLIGGLLASASTRRGAVGAAGLWAGLGSAAVFVAAGRGDLPTTTLLSGAAGSLMGGALSGALVLALSPVGERLFGHVSTLTLLESLSYDHPLVRQLMTVAPGTFLHSTNVAVLADAGAHAIGADPLVARVGALYHDVGKTRAPVFFIENQKGENPHDGLPPAVSAGLFKAHISDGVALAARHGLAPRIAPFIREHHGTAVMRSIAEKPGAEALPPSTFRYPGPRPQSRATGLLMIADQVEATARAVQPPSLEACMELVDSTVDRIVAEDQLADSGLSRADLDALVRVLAEVIHAIHHRRVQYPAELRAASPGLP